MPCAGAPVRPLSPQALCEQQATRFPLVSGDAAWLSGQSVPVLARRLAPDGARYAVRSRFALGARTCSDDRGDDDEIGSR